MDPFLANQLATREARDAAANANALVVVGQTGVSEVSAKRSWTKHPIFWFGLAAAAGLGVVSMAMRSGKKPKKARRASEPVVSPESLFETLEDTGGLDDDDEVIEEEAPDEEIEEPEIVSAAPPEKPKRKPRKRKEPEIVAAPPEKPKRKPRKSRAKKEPTHAAV